MGYRSDFKKNLKEIFEYKYVKIAFIVNFIYFVIGIIYFYLSPELRGIIFGFEIEGNDFGVFFQAGYLAKNDIDNLYNPDAYVFPFRYLPMTAYIFWLVLGVFTGLPMEVCYIAFALANLLINIPIIVMIYHIIFGMFKIDKDTHGKRVKQYIMMYLLFGPHIDNYLNGQVNSFLAFFLLCSLYFFEYPNYKDRDPEDKPVDHYDFYGGVFFGLAILTKISAIILVPFIIVLRIIMKPPRIKDDKVPPKEEKSIDLNFLNKVKLNIPIAPNLNRLAFPAFLFVMNLFLFIVNPGMFERFKEINFSGDATQVWQHSFSLVRITLNIIELITNTVPTAQTSSVVLYSFFIPIFFLVFWSYGRNMNNQRILPMYYSLGILTLLIGYYDSWAHHLIVFMPFLIISLVQIKDAVVSEQLAEKENKTYVCSIDCIHNVSNKHYNIIRMNFIFTGLYFWTLFFFLLEDLGVKPGLNIFYTIFLTFIYAYLLIVLNKR